MLSHYVFGPCEATLRFEASGPWRGCWELVSLTTKPELRQSGYATALMDVICERADAEGATLHVTARPVASVTDEVLRKFYEKFGFESYPGVGRAAQYSMLRKVRVQS